MSETCEACGWPGAPRIPEGGHYDELHTEIFNLTRQLEEARAALEEVTYIAEGFRGHVDVQDRIRLQNARRILAEKL